MITIAALTGMNAQTYKWWAGGHTTLWTGDSWWGGKVNTFIVAPEVGYLLSPKFTIAASVGFYSEYYKNPSSSEIGMVLNPYMRYTAFKQGILLGFIDGGVDVGLGDFDGFQFGFKPGVALLLTERFTIATQFGFLGYNDGKEIGNRKQGFGLDLSGYCSTIAFFYSF
jgi:hypothetical protein